MGLGLSGLIFAALGLAGIVVRPDTQALIDRSLTGLTNLIQGMIKNKKEPTPEEVVLMNAELDAGNLGWDGILGDWN